MSAAGDGAIFAAAAAVSLATSWVLVSRIERIGARLGATEVLLGLASALAADAPEITSAVSAISHHQGAVGAGVVIGSNVFNLAALLGLGAVVAGGVVVHRHAVAFQGVIALWVALVCLVMIVGVVTPDVGLVLVAAAILPYVVLSSGDRSPWARSKSPVKRWVATALAEEELELRATVHPRRGGALDVAVGLVALLVVVVASVTMERAASDLGARTHMPEILVGGIVLAAVTSLPNAVAAIFWARRGRGIATLSTALNSNALNVAAGLFVPAAVVGIGSLTSSEALAAAWYVGLSGLVLGFAYLHHGVRRPVGWLVLAGYVAFVGALVAVA